MFTPTTYNELQKLLNEQTKLINIDLSKLDNLSFAFCYRDLDFVSLNNRNLSHVKSFSKAFLCSSIKDASTINMNGSNNFFSAFTMTKIKKPPILKTKGPVCVDEMFSLCRELDSGFVDCLFQWNNDIVVEGVATMFKYSNLGKIVTINDMPLWYKKAVMKLLDCNLNFDNLIYLR